MAPLSSSDETDGGLWLPVKRARAHELVIEVIEDRILSAPSRSATPSRPSASSRRASR